MDRVPLLLSSPSILYPPFPPSPIQGMEYLHGQGTPIALLSLYIISPLPPFPYTGYGVPTWTGYPYCSPLPLYYIPPSPPYTGYGVPTWAWYPSRPALLSLHLPPLSSLYLPRSSILSLRRPPARAPQVPLPPSGVCP